MNVIQAPRSFFIRMKKSCFVMITVPASSSWRRTTNMMMINNNNNNSSILLHTERRTKTTTIVTRRPRDAAGAVLLFSSSSSSSCASSSSSSTSASAVYLHLRPSLLRLCRYHNRRHHDHQKHHHHNNNNNSSNHQKMMQQMMTTATNCTSNTAPTTTSMTRTRFWWPQKQSKQQHPQQLYSMFPLLFFPSNRSRSRTVSTCVQSAASSITILCSTTRGISASRTTSRRNSRASTNSTTIVARNSTSKNNEIVVDDSLRTTSPNMITSQSGVTHDDLLTVAILGPPNAGKSTLFNRFLDKEQNQSYRLYSDKLNMARGRRGGRKHRNSGGRIAGYRPIRRPTTSSSSTGIGASGGASGGAVAGGGGALVTSVPGTTRDRRDGIGRIANTYFWLMDTAGVDGYRLDQYYKNRITTIKQKQQHHVNNNSKDDGIQQKTMTPVKIYQQQQQQQQRPPIEEDPQMLTAMMQQTTNAAFQADLVVLMFDGRVGVTSDLLETARWLRRSITKKKKYISNTSEDTTHTTRTVISSSDSFSTDNESSTQSEEKRHNQLSRDQSTYRKVIVVANKLENDHVWDYDGSPILDHLSEATRLGFGSAIPISAIHGDGLSDLAMIMEEMSKQKQQQLSSLTVQEASQVVVQDPNVPVPWTNDQENHKNSRSEMLTGDGDGEIQGDRPLKRNLKKERPLQLAILGRPNVGKSTLVNALLGQDRVIVGPTPGLTRDAIAVSWSWCGRPVRLVDTAGIRKRTSKAPAKLFAQPQHVIHQEQLEGLAVQDALRAMKVADVAVLVLDAQARLLQSHEMSIADTILKEGRALVIVANKMDLIVEPDYTKRDFERGVRDQLEARFPMLRGTPIVAMSSLTGESVEELMPVVFKARDRWSRQVSTGQLNRWLAEVLLEKSPPLASGRPIRIKYIIQTKGRPPTFMLFCNNPDIQESYRRYLIRQIQDSFNMHGMPIRLVLRRSSIKNPFVKASVNHQRGGSGLGGRQQRHKRIIHSLRTTGQPKVQRRRRRRQWS